MLNFDHIPIVDHHAHPLLPRAATGEPLRFQRWFTESTAPVMQREHAGNLLVYRTAIRWLAAFLGCAATVDAVLAARSQIDEHAWTARLFADANIGLVLCDYGYGGDGAFDHATMQARLPCPVHPVLRLERLAEDLIVSQPTFDQMTDAFTATLATARARGVVSFKSIAAYRTGLQIDAPDPHAARQDFRRLKETAAQTGRVRLAHKALNDYLLDLALTAAARQELPVQFHTGFGDSDADLRLANPLHLRRVIEGYPATQLVLLHSGWPYYRELAHLAAIYPNVWLDLSLAIPFATTGIPAMLRDVLGMAPFSKVLFATDAFTMPEIYWVAARWGRWGLTQVLDDFVHAGFFTAAEAHQAAQAILADNARRLYPIGAEP